MPHKARKPCAYHGCSYLVNARYCSEHAKAEAVRYNRYGRHHERDKYYGQPWKRICAAFIREAVTDAKAEATHYNRFNRDRQRDKYYGRTWKQIRTAFNR